MAKQNRRDFLRTSVAAGTAVYLGTSTQAKSHASLGAIEDVSLGFISCGSRAGQLMGEFAKVDGVNVAGLCDPDEGRLEAAKTRNPRAKGWTDVRGLLDDDSIDAVVIATCNHWHCLAAIWAMEAGKDVYVEKPLSHSQWEGLQTVKTARKTGRVCQLGTQQRSDPMQDEIKKFLHEEKALGEVISARVNRYGVRAPIGKRSTPLTIDGKVDYNQWLGPAQDMALYRDKLHYDWHWDWNTGSGEMGNWGVHVLDDCRNNVFLDKIGLPRRIFGGGGRVAWGDAGNTPNVHFVYFDTGTIPVVIGLSNMKAGPDQKGAAPHPGPGSGYIAYCEGGRYEGQRGRGAAFDSDGNKIKEFRGNSGGVVHQANFIDAVRAQDPSMLNSEVKVGHDSTGWCNLANIAYQTGENFAFADARSIDDPAGVWNGLLEEMESHLGQHGVKMESAEIKLSPVLNVDVENEVFVGDNADVANQFIKREYRDGFEVKEVS